MGLGAHLNEPLYHAVVYAQCGVDWPGPKQRGGHCPPKPLGCEIWYRKRLHQLADIILTKARKPECGSSSHIKKKKKEKIISNLCKRRSTKLKECG